MVQDSLENAIKLWESLDTTSIFDFPKEPDLFSYTKAFFKQGGICRNGLETLIKTHLQEDYIRTSPISLGMMLTRKEDLTPCGVFTEEIPQGMLCDYLMATTACFPAAKHHTISGVDYIDGGYCDNLPVKLAREKGADKIIAVSLNTQNGNRSPFPKHADFITIYPKWNLGNWLVFHKENTKRNLRLGYLDAYKAFGIYEGDAFTFHKNTFQTLSQKAKLPYPLQKRLLSMEASDPEKLLKKTAEAVGKFLRISPYCVYTADSFLKAIHRKLDCRKSFPKARPFSQNPEEELVIAFLSVFA